MSGYCFNLVEGVIMKKKVKKVVNKMAKKVEKKVEDKAVKKIKGREVARNNMVTEN